MRRTLVCATLALAPLAAPAQVRSFPYEAVVETDGVPIHSGPGQRYYETTKLARGDRVIVHRHDPGGWYMIAPPAGEFSLILAEEARPDGAGGAEIVAGEASVRIGSTLADARDVEQVRLTRGDRVRLADGIQPPAGWLAIAPPRGEYRWVAGRFLVPAHPAVRSELDADPFAVPSIAKRPESFEVATKVTASKPSSLEQGPALSLGPPEIDAPAPAVADVTRSIRMLDRELEGLALSEPTDWPLDELAAEYRRLRKASPASGRQIDVRLAQIERMRMVKDHYSDYVRLTSATDERDAALLARLDGAKARRVARAATPDSGSPAVTLAPPLRLAASTDETARPLPPPAPPAEPPGPKPEVQGGPPYATTGVLKPAPQRSNVTPVSSGPILAPPPSQAVAAETSSVPQVAPTGAQRFDAVGVVQKAVAPHAEAPRHVLVAPNGRILVYLREQPGVALDRFVGQAMGVDGERHRHPELTTPMIVVERLMPVRL